MMQLVTTWLITREAEDAREERESLSARGLDSVTVPCVETVSLPWPWSTPAQGRTLTFFTSRRSVLSWLAAGKPALGDAAAIAPATAQLLHEEGVTPVVESEGGVIPLSQKLLTWWRGVGCPALTVRYPTSNAGIHAPEQAEAVRLLSKLVEVDRQLAYEVRAPEGLRESLERATRAEWAVTFASPSAVKHFLFAGSAIARAPEQVICRGGSTRRAWNTARPAGWPEAHAATDVHPSHPEVHS